MHPQNSTFTVRHEIAVKLQAQPWNIHPTQHADFCAWLCGLTSLRGPALAFLTNGEAASVLERLSGERDPETMKTRWMDARVTEHTGKSLEQLNEEALAWLR